MVAKALFLCKRARPDIQPTIAVLCTRVKEPNEANWAKLVRMLKYLNGTRELRLTLSAANLNCIKWWVDASFAVHPDFKSHTGAAMKFGDGKGAAQSISRKQKLNTKSSTESELVGADDISVMILWTKLFLEEQGYEIEKNILYQDNKSAILFETNGKKSSGKRTRALNIRYFFLTDQVEKGNLTIEYCPTDDMVGDFHTKPLQGEKFRKFRNEILGCELFFFLKKKEEKIHDCVKSTYTMYWNVHGYKKEIAECESEEYVRIREKDTKNEYTRSEEDQTG